MAPLPIARITTRDPPFTSVGIDYFGPIPVKLKTSRFLFVGITRFVSRRGVPTEVYSDNGTNFRGAENEVKRALETWNQSRITESMRRRDVQETSLLHPQISIHGTGGKLNV